MRASWGRVLIRQRACHRQSFQLSRLASGKKRFRKALLRVLVGKFSFRRLWYG
jgi:hypothetical protein